jgi:FMN phosphatase YigB (HAD superfamily)
MAESLGLSRMPHVQPPASSLVRALVLPGVEEMLWTLRHYQVRLGIVTNGFSAFQTPFLKALGWDYVFDAIITPDRAGTAKPDPAIMAAVSPGLAHIGDRRSHDVLVAMRSHRWSIYLMNQLPETDYIDPLSPATIVPHFTVKNIPAATAIIRTLVRA